MEERVLNLVWTTGASKSYGISNCFCEIPMNICVPNRPRFYEKKETSSYSSGRSVGLSGCLVLRSIIDVNTATCYSNFSFTTYVER